MRQRPVADNARPSTGLTLLELLIAISILTLILGSLFVTLRTAMRAYRDGSRGSAKIQTLRFVTDYINRDARSVFYKTYNEYNRRYRDQERIRRAMEEERQLNGLPEDAQNNPDWVDPLGYNPLDFMYKIDLSFEGKAQEFTFSRYQPTQGEMATQPWSLARVTYKFNPSKKAIERIEKSVFTRSTSTEDAEENDGEDADFAIVSRPGEPKSALPALPDTTLSEVVAENVVEFSLHYGYYYDGQWLESTSWESNESSHRNPKIETDPEDPDAPQINNFNKNCPPDDLPAYIDMDIVVVDADDETQRLALRHLVLLPPARETHSPIPPDLSAAGFERSSEHDGEAIGVE